MRVVKLLSSSKQLLVQFADDEENGAKPTPSQFCIGVTYAFAHSVLKLEIG